MSRFQLHIANLAHVRDVFRMRSDIRSECGARGQFRKLPPGGFGHHAAGNKWPAVGATGLGQVGVGNRPPSRIIVAAASQEAWHSRSKNGVASLAYELDGDVPTSPGRAAVERRQASVLRRARCRARKARTVGYASVGVPLPFFLTRSVG